jgi:hypothetical protein
VEKDGENATKKRILSRVKLLGIMYIQFNLQKQTPKTYDVRDRHMTSETDTDMWGGVFLSRLFEACVEVLRSIKKNPNHPPLQYFFSVLIKFDTAHIVIPPAIQREGGI